MTSIPVVCDLGDAETEYTLRLKEQEGREAHTIFLADRTGDQCPTDRLFCDVLNAWAIREQIARLREHEAELAEVRAEADSSGKNEATRRADALGQPEVQRLRALADRARVDARAADRMVTHLMGRRHATEGGER